MNLWYETFLKHVADRKEVSYTGLIAQSDSLSDGINHLMMTELYRTALSQAMRESVRIQGYSQSAGHPLLVYGIQYYERILAGLSKNKQTFANNVSVTAGATAAIQICISYLVNSEKIDKVLSVGMSYYLFQKSCQQNGAEFSLIISEEGESPSAQQVCQEICSNPKSLVLLTQPANPTGELYLKQDFIEILNFCKDYHCMILLDLCQMDELVMNEEFLNTNRLIVENCAQNQVIIINSFSKIRSLAGARLGYIVTQDNMLGKYAEYCNEMLYFNHSLGFENAVMMDLFYRTIIRMPEDRRKEVIRDFRNIILQTAGIHCYQDVFQPILHSEKLMEDALKFKNELLANASVIHNNYEFCKKMILNGMPEFKITKLSGGYNFCIRVPMFENKDEEKFCLELSYLLGTNLLSQRCFCYPLENPEAGLWIRISAAMPSDRFEAYIMKLKQWGEKHYAGN